MLDECWQCPDMCSPFPREFYFCTIAMVVMFPGMAVLLFVDSNVFFAARTAFTVVFVDFDLFLCVLSAVLATGK